MKKSDFFYELPPELIAQTPLDKRDASRLMVINRQTGGVAHKSFSQICDYLKPGDCLVLNNTKVLHARLNGNRSTGGQAELLLLHPHGGDVWETLARPGRKITEGVELSFGDGQLTAKVLEVLENGNRVVRLHYDAPDFYALLREIGTIPLPHYIHEELKNPDRYQTVYSKELGSVAAPTAGLHFTPELLEKIKAMGVEIATLTLHVGVGTFRPVKVENITDHVMHSEHYELPQEAVDKIEKAKSSGGRVIAVGTTASRTLEGVWKQHGKLLACTGSTDIFIYPPYAFGVIDGLITNFHLPESTLIMLVSAFAGREPILAAYKEAVQQQYRFFSFGDAMLIL